MKLLLTIAICAIIEFTGGFASAAQARGIAETGYYEVADGESGGMGHETGRS